MHVALAVSQDEGRQGRLSVEYIENIEGSGHSGTAGRGMQAQVHWLLFFRSQAFHLLLFLGLLRQSGCVVTVEL